MAQNLRLLSLALSLCALIGFALPAPVQAGTILGLSLGNAAYDIEYNAGTLHTLDNGNLASPGDQDTGILYLNELDGYAPDVVAAPFGSFTMGGLVPSGNATLIFGSSIVQNFNGGSMTLYDQNGNVLLAGTMNTSALAGALNNPTGGLFTTTFGHISSGLLLPYIDPDTFQMSMNFTSIKTIPGLQTGLTLVSPPPVGDFVPVQLNPFKADASVDIQANPAVPEPTSLALFALVSGVVAISTRRASRLRVLA